MDHFLLRSIIGAHSKVPTEHLYLETGALPIPHIIRIRRLCYLKTLLQRPESEITRKVYESQKRKVTKGDWFETVQKDKEILEISMNDEEIEKMHSEDYKAMVKDKVRKSAFKELEQMKDSHIKVRENEYKASAPGLVVIMDTKSK